MLHEAKKAKETLYKIERKNELQEVSKLKENIEKEKVQKKEKRKQEMEAARLVILENEREKKNRILKE